MKQQLLASLTNLGRPQIAVRDGNYKNRGELFLEHTLHRRRTADRLRPRHARAICIGCGIDRCI